MGENGSKRMVLEQKWKGKAWKGKEGKRKDKEGGLMRSWRNGITYKGKQGEGADAAGIGADIGKGSATSIACTLRIMVGHKTMQNEGKKIKKVNKLV